MQLLLKKQDFLPLNVFKTGTLCQQYCEESGYAVGLTAAQNASTA